MADHPLAVQGLSDAAKEAGVKLRVLTDLATSINRTGATPEQVVALAKQIDSDPHLHFAGILIYPSYVGERPAVLDALVELEQAGIEAEMVSGGGTGAALEAGDFPELTELRVGTYLFNDWRTVSRGWTTQEHCAMTIAATVISTPTADRVILDSGSKTLAADRVDERHGHIVEYPDARIYGTSEEHGHVDVSHCVQKPKLGERVHVIPVHTCVVTNLRNQIYGVRNGEVEVTWPVAARGLVW
jgi:D-serine deaminase-like pyridoxal phosphate-dependent protein